MISMTSIAERLAFTFALAFVYGLQRQRSHKPVGFGTFILVSTGACALTISALNVGFPDAILLLSAIVTSIGFLGAGALIKGSDRIFGFTTAASVWVFAIFGLIVGLGYFGIATLTYISVWLVVAFDRYLETKGIGSYRKKITIKTKIFVNKKEISDLLASYCSNQTLINIQINKKEKQVTLNYLIQGLKKDVENLLKELYRRKWCIYVGFE